MKSIIQYITLFCFLISTTFVIAHEDYTFTESDVRQKTQITSNPNNPNSVLSVQDQSYYPPNNPFNPNWVVNREVQVHLKYLRDDHTDVWGKFFKYRVRYELKYYGSNLPPKEDVVEISFEDGQGVYEDVKRYADAPLDAGITIIAVEGYDVTNGGGWQSTGLSFVPDDIELELRMEVERFDYLNPSATPTLSDDYQFNNTTGAEYSYIELNWQPVTGAEATEIEYVFWDSETTVMPAPNDWDAIFKNSVTVQVNSTNYKIDLSYPSGVLYCRVRSIGRYIRGNVNGDYSHEKYGAWSNVTQTALTAFEEDKSWNYSLSYAEEGKYKKVLSYFDGTMRSRQVLTNLSTEELTLVAESDYNVEGGGAIGILPAPVRGAENNLFFKPNFNKNTSGNSYNFRDFDKNNGAEPLDNTSGAGQYYSTNNNSTGIYRDYLPDAEGYPMTETRFMRDGTGRVKSQSGVGAFYKTGSGRETKYAYGTPTQTELDRLFGTNVGNALHYKKNAVIDANGQVNVAYIDQAGQTIATALAGHSPNNVLPLDSEGAFMITSDLMGHNNIINDEESLAENVLLNVIPNASYNFTYDLTGVKEAITLGGGTYCHTCEYELSIRIIDPEGDLVSIAYNGANTTEITKTYTPTDLTCTTNSFTEAPLSFSAIFIEIGNYRVVKSLKAIQPSSSELLDDLMNAGVIPNVQDYINQYLTQVDTLSCFYDDSHYCYYLAMEQGLTGAAFDAFIVNCLDTATADSLYTIAINEVTVSECNSILGQIEAQVSPNGDYYEENYSIDFWSVVDLKDDDLNDLTFELLDVNGTTYTYTPNTYGVSPLPPNTTIHLYDASNPATPYAFDILSGANAFITNVLQNPNLWQTQWATTLAQEHVEYCQYEYCTYTTKSRTFNAELSRYETWEDYLGSAYQSGDWSILFNADPLFNSVTTISNSPLYGNWANDMSTLLGNYETHPVTTVSLDLYEWVDYILTNHPDWNTWTLNQQEKQRWQLFTSMYVAAKKELEHDKSYDGCTLVTEDYAVVPIPATFDMDDEQNIINFVNTQMGNHCADMCAAQVDKWINQLNALLTDNCTGTTALGTHEAQVRTLLENYCSNSCGTGNPLGELLIEDIATNPDLILIQDLLNNTIIPSGGCDPSLVNLLDSIGFSFQNIYSYATDGNGNTVYTSTICMNKLVEALNEFVLDCAPSSVDLTTNTYYNECFLGIDYDGDELKVQCTDGTWQSFALIGSNGSQINYCNTIISEVTVDLTYDTDPNYLGIVFKMRPSTGGTIFNAYLYAFNGQSKPCIDPYNAVVTYDPGMNFTINLDSMWQWCIDEQIALLTSQAIAAWQNDVNDILGEVLQEMGTNCFDTPYAESFSATYQLLEHHYTLYYYDQVGSLVQTVPPEGVRPLPLSDFGSKGEWLNAGNPAANPPHILLTKYKYNTIGGLYASNTPDAGTSEFFYDKVGRLRLSRDAQQKNDGHYSYTRFDDQSRITEVGQIEDYGNLQQTDLDDIEFPQNTQYTLTQQTFTEYDEAPQTTFEQQHLRGRVAKTRHQGYEARYSYDIHGNVTNMQQVIEGLGTFDLEYTFDLISGNVKEFAYQKGKPDQFYHRYTYDADNRIREVYTSDDGIVFDRDATYLYYEHGALARVELGNDAIQGVDYYNNLQGWIKGVNMPGTTDGLEDPGQDGYVANGGSMNKWFGRDEYSYVLGYHDQDFKTVGTIQKTDAFKNIWTDLRLNQNISVNNLYNGNISVMITDIEELTQLGTDSRMNTYAYQYDALHRIREGHSANVDNGIWKFNGQYDVNYTYDAMGNIKTLQRTGKGLLIDDLTYEYDYNGTDLKHNQLLYVTDASNSNPNIPQPGNVNYMGDLQTQNAGNYTYDDIGNLTADQSEHIQAIAWRVDGKVESVTYTQAGLSLGKTNLSFGYDATGNRLYKHLQNEAQEKTWYIRDPSGNTLMMYKTTDKENSLGQYREITQSEAHLYGSKRLGIQKIDQLIGKMPIGQQTTAQEEGAKAVENLRISELLYDSPMTPNNGTTETYLGEFVALYNIGIEPINLEDISLTSDNNGVVDFGQGTQIQSGQTVIVAYGTPSDKDDFLKVNDLWGKIDETQVQWYWQTNLTLIDDQNTVTLSWTNPDEPQDVVVVDVIEYEQEMADNDFFDLSTWTPTITRPAVRTVQRELAEAIAIREALYQEYGIEDQYQTYLEERFSLALAQQQAVITGSGEGGIAELTDEELMARVQQELAALYDPYSPNDYTLSPFQWGQSEAVGQVITYQQTRGSVYYELSNHLGNVLVTVSNQKIGVEDGSTGQALYYEATVVSVNDYYPFGWGMPRRKYNEPDYRYGFNGQEKEDDISGSGNNLIFKYRIHDSRLGRFLSVDPLAPEYPWNSTYAFAENRVIRAMDLEGAEALNKNNYQYTGNMIIVFEEHKFEALKNSPHNKNWDYMLVYDLGKAYVELKNYIKQGGSIKNLVIKTHGNTKGMVISPNNQDIVASSKDASEDRKHRYLSKQDIQAYDRARYNTVGRGIGYPSEEMFNREIFPIKTGNKASSRSMTIFKDLTSLFKIFSVLEENASIFMMGCNLGTEELAQRFTKTAYYATGRTDFTYHFNKDRNVGSMTIGPRDDRIKVILDYPQGSIKYYNQGYIKINIKIKEGIPTSLIKPYSKGIVPQFNATGDPVSMEELPIKKSDTTKETCDDCNNNN